MGLGDGTASPRDSRSLVLLEQAACPSDFGQVVASRVRVTRTRRGNDPLHALDVPPCVAAHRISDARCLGVGCPDPGEFVKSKTPLRLAVAAGIVATTTAVAFGTVNIANASTPEPTATNASAARAEAAVAGVPTVAAIKAATIAKYGVFPLPVPEAQIARYRLSKKHLHQIVAAKKFAATAKARSVRQCESGGNYKIATGNGYYGAYQFDRGTWLSNGGGRYGITANRAPAWAQDHIMWKTQRARGWSPWACA